MMSSWSYIFCCVSVLNSRKQRMERPLFPVLWQESASALANSLPQVPAPKKTHCYCDFWVFRTCHFHKDIFTFVLVPLPYKSASQEQFYAKITTHSEMHETVFLASIKYIKIILVKACINMSLFLKEFVTEEIHVNLWPCNEYHVWKCLRQKVLC